MPTPQTGTTKRTRSPRLPSPLAVATAAVNGLYVSASDWDSEFVFRMFAEPTDGPFSAILEAVAAGRKAAEARGERNPSDEPDGSWADEVHAAFTLGFAMGAKFGGAR
jgi:hypothetical protein